jgi:hypothetical protein
MKYQQRLTKSQRKNTFLVMLTAILLAILCFVAVGCVAEYMLVLKFENRTDQVLTLYVNSHRIVDINPGETIESPTVPFVTSRYLIEAKNVKGEVVYSKVFTDMEIRPFSKIVIPPPSK